jgi:biopolymer transport protein ExbB
MAFRSLRDFVFPLVLTVLASAAFAQGAPTDQVPVGSLQPGIAAPAGPAQAPVDTPRPAEAGKFTTDATLAPAAPTAAAPTPAAPGNGTSVAPEPSPGRSLSPLAKPGHELSAWSMFMDADILVKGVMVGLAFASVLTWTIFLGKTAELMLSKARLRKSVRLLESSGSLLEAQVKMGKQRDVTAVLVQQAVQEVRLSSDIHGEAGLRERVASRFAEVQRTEGRIIRRGMGLLATIGSTAPFVGLFGTVWGIMNSFIGIAKSQTTNLAVVAPGIAEALLATAIGLVAAIPAVIVYNHFARTTKGYMEAVGRSAGVVGRLLSRDLDRARGRPLAHAAE